MKSITPIAGTLAMAVNEDALDEGDWIVCDGRELSRNEYSELFNYIGIKFGKGDGKTTFNIPKYPIEFGDTYCFFRVIQSR